MLGIFGIAAMSLLSLAEAVPESANTVSEPAATAGAQPAADAKKERLICKRQSTIGSLVAKTRVCLTKQEWEIANQRGQEAARGAVDSCSTRGAGIGCGFPAKAPY